MTRLPLVRWRNLLLVRGLDLRLVLASSICLPLSDLIPSKGGPDRIDGPDDDATAPTANPLLPWIRIPLNGTDASADVRGPAL